MITAAGRGAPWPCETPGVTAELSLVALLLVAAAVAGVSARFGYSSPLVLTAVGIGLSFVPGVPSYPLTPQLALTGFLPPLLYAAAIRTPFVDMRATVRPILSLSVGLVARHDAGGRGRRRAGCSPASPLAAAFALGAVVAPPDAVAATAVARRVGMPRRIVTILEGESLLNDATALVALPHGARRAGRRASTLGGRRRLRARHRRRRGWSAWGSPSCSRRCAGASTTRCSTPRCRCSALRRVPRRRGARTGRACSRSSSPGWSSATRSPASSPPRRGSPSARKWRTVQFLLENAVFLLIGLQLRSLVEQARQQLPRGRPHPAALPRRDGDVIVVRHRLDVPRALPAAPAAGP